MDTLHQGGEASGPLRGTRVLEIAGLGPVTFAAMLLADMGAEVVRIARPGHVEMEKGATLRGRKRLSLDLRSPQGKAAALDLTAGADVLLEGFRPGVMERLELGPAAALARNPRLVYGRMTGWGQTGPRSATAGHDIDYIAIAGALHAIGDEAPVVPLNLVGDYGGGALYLAMGVLAGVLHARSTGAGQVVDCAICDGTVSLLSLMHGLRHVGRWRDERQGNSLDGAAPYYRTYRCGDGRYIAVGAIEPAFQELLLQRLGIDGEPFTDLHDRSRWPEQAKALQDAFATRSRDEWAGLFADSDACVAPVNSISDSLQDPHLRSRAAFVELAGETQPAPAPRFMASPSEARASAEAELETLLDAWGGSR